MEKKILKELQNITKELKVIARNTKKEKLVEIETVELKEHEPDIDKIAQSLYKKLNENHINIG